MLRALYCRVSYYSPAVGQLYQLTPARAAILAAAGNSASVAANVAVAVAVFAVALVTAMAAVAAAAANSASVAAHVAAAVAVVAVALVTAVAAIVGDVRRQRWVIPKCLRVLVVDAKWLRVAAITCTNNSSSLSPSLTARAV